MAGLSEVLQYVLEVIINRKCPAGFTDPTLIRFNDPLRQHRPSLRLPASTGQLIISVDWVKDTSVCCPASDTKGHPMHCPQVHEFIIGPVVTGTLHGLRGGQGVISPLTWPALLVVIT